jgi:hypothetical protein
MFRKMATLMVGASLLVGLVSACAGNQTGTSEGGGCSSDDACDVDLWCQPVTGRNGDFCCPSPLVYPDGTFASGQTNCQPTQHSY